MWKSLFVSIIVVAASVASAHAWSEQNCMSMCRLTAPSGRVAACIARDCAKHRGQTHESDERVQKAAARWKERNYLVGSMYQGKMSGGRTYRHRRGICGARAHSPGTARYLASAAPGSIESGNFVKAGTFVR
jgi:hypothetical protein